jgi:hypothetical protein
LCHVSGGQCRLGGPTWISALIGFAQIAGGAPSSTSAMGAHLMNNTLGLNAGPAAYYSLGGVPEGQWFELAYAVDNGEITHGEAVDILMLQWNKTWDTGDEDLYFAARSRYAERFEDVLFRVQEGLALAPVAVVRPDVEAGVMLGLGIEPGMLLNAQEVNAFLAGLKIDGSPVEGRRYVTQYELPSDPKTKERRWATPIGSYDFCPTPSKSVSCSWAMASDVERALIYNCHLEAAREAVGYIADEIGVMGIGDKAKDGWEKGATCWLEFSHHTSRRVQVETSTATGEKEIKDAGLAGDPNLHTHFLISANVFTPSGRVGSLDTMGIRGFIHEADGYYQARLATKLRDAGFEVELDGRTGAARMTVIPEHINTLFSKRTNAGEELARKYTSDLGEDWDAISQDQREARTKAATQSREQRANAEKDPVADFAGWRQQAKEAGWEAPRSLQLIGPPERLLEKAERDRKAYEISLPWLEKKLEHRSVVPHWDLRLAALRGLIATRCDGLVDIKPVTRLMHEEGVMQQGEKTAIRYGEEEGKRYTSITTDLHLDQEAAFVRLGTGAARDKSGAIPIGLLRQKMRESGMDFTTTHGKEQAKAIETVGAGGRFAVVIGVPGAGKSSLLKPLVASWHEMGRDVWASSVAWRQTDDLYKAGIPRQRLMAFSVLMDRIRDGSVKLTLNSVVAIDEWGQLGTKQGLDLLRAREKYGFTLVSLGDDSQIGSIQAGAIFNLSRRVLGEHAIPEITETKRQQTEREREIARLFREGEAATALGMKRADGTAELAYGGAQGVIKRVAKVYAERLEATGLAPTIGAPTNSDAHRIGEAVRIERRRLGLLGADVKVLKATDGERDYSLPIAIGEQLRLHKSTKAFMGMGVRRNGSQYRIERSIGRNGSVLDVVDFTTDGVRLRARDGREGNVKWSAMPSEGDRTKLSYGYAWTNHISQGYGGPGHIMALPGGSAAVGGSAAYTALTRHEWWCNLISSEAAERIAVQQSRPVNDKHSITEDDKWAIVAKNFVNQKKSDSALDLLDKIHGLRRGGLQAFHTAVRPAGPAQAPEIVQRRMLDIALERISRGIRNVREAYQHHQRFPGPTR